MRTRIVARSYSFFWLTCTTARPTLVAGALRRAWNGQEASPVRSASERKPSTRACARCVSFVRAGDGAKTPPSLPNYFKRQRRSKCESILDAVRNDSQFSEARQRHYDCPSCLLHAGTHCSGSSRDDGQARLRRDCDSRKRRGLESNWRDHRPGHYVACSSHG